jgi:hypothetical protein
MMLQSSGDLVYFTQTIPGTAEELGRLLPGIRDCGTGQVIQVLFA